MSDVPAARSLPTAAGRAATPPTTALARLPRWIVIGIALLGALLMWTLADVLLLVYAALLLAVLLRGLAAPLSERLPLSDRVALVLVVIALLAVVLGALALFGAQVQAQLTELGNRLPGAWQSLRAEWAGTRLGAQLVEWVERTLAGDGGGGRDVAAIVARGVGMLAGTLTSLLLVIAGAIYFAAQPGVYWRGAIGLLPPTWRTGAKDVLTAVAQALRRWLLAQLAAMLLVGTLVGIGCALLGLPSALALGLIAGLAEFVPVAGSVASALPALLLAATLGWDTLLWTALMYVAIQQLEGNVISPLVIRRSVAVPPAVTLFAILAFGTIFGVMGVLLAAPLAVTVHVLVSEFWARRLPPPVPASQGAPTRSTRAA